MNLIGVILSSATTSDHDKKNNIVYHVPLGRACSSRVVGQSGCFNGRLPLLAPDMIGIMLNEKYKSCQKILTLKNGKWVAGII